MSVPQPLAGEFDERVFESRTLEVDVDDLEPVLIDPLDDAHQRLGGVRRVDGEASPVRCEDGGLRSLEGGDAVRGEGRAGRDLDARLAQRAGLDLARGS